MIKIRLSENKNSKINNMLNIIGFNLLNNNFIFLPVEVFSSKATFIPK